MSFNRGINNNDHRENEDEDRANRTSEAAAVREFLHRERGERESSAHHVEEFMRQFSSADIHFMNGLMEIMATHETSSTASPSRHENQNDGESGEGDTTDGYMQSLAWAEGFQLDSNEDETFDDVHNNMDGHQEEIDENNDESMLERPRNATGPRVHLASNDADDDDVDFMPSLVSRNLRNDDLSQGGDDDDDDDYSMPMPPSRSRYLNDDVSQGGHGSSHTRAGEGLAEYGPLPRVTLMSMDNLFRNTIMQDLRTRLIERVGRVTFHDPGTMMGIGMRFDSDTESDDGLSVADQDDDIYCAQAFFRSDHTVRLLEQGHDMYVTTGSNEVEDKGGVSEDDETRQAGVLLPHTYGDPTCYKHEEVLRQVDPGHIGHNRGLSASADNNNNDDDMSTDPEMPVLMSRHHRDINDSSSTDSSIPDVVPRYGGQMPPLIRVHGSDRRSPRLVGDNVGIDLDYDVNLPDLSLPSSRQRARHAPDLNQYLESGAT